MLRRKKRVRGDEGNYQPDTPSEQTFNAYIIKGNRQVVSRLVTASKRFKVDEEMYRIKDECIFLKMIDGRFRSVAYYREGNPEPYSFEHENHGITAAELDRMYAEDFYTIITNLVVTNRSMYILLIVCVNLGLCAAFLVGVAIRALS